MSRVLQHDEARALADGHTASGEIERPAGIGVEQAKRVEAHEADARERIGAAGERHRHHAIGDEIGGNGERRGARAARRDQRLARPTQAEARAHDVGVRIRQDGAKGVHRSRRDAAAPGVPVPRFGLQHAATNGADDERRALSLGGAEPGVVDRFTSRGQGQAIGARAAWRPGHRIGHLGGDPAAEAVGLDQRDRTDRARPRAHAFPVGLHTGPEGADGAEAGDDDALHVVVARSAMKWHSVWNVAK